MTTTSKQIKTSAISYILNAIDGSGYDKELTTDQEKLQFLCDTFASEYCFPDNLKRYKTYQNVLAQWLMGLPSSFHIDYENYRIIEIAKEWGSIPQDANDKQEDKILANWWNFIASNTLQLFNKHNIDYINLCR